MKKFKLPKLSTLLPVIIIGIGLVVAGVVMFAPKSQSTKPSGNPSLSQIEACGTENQFKCYSDYFTAKTEATEAKEALADLRTLYDKGDEYAKSQCHQLAHEVGHVGYKKYGSLSAAFTKGDAFCWSGYYHGVTEEAVGDMGPERMRAEANDICKDLAATKRYSFDHYNCVHGLGHGFMTVDNFNLFKALTTCDLLKDEWERTSCYGGVFMENVMVAVREGNKSEYLRPQEPLYPCTAVETPYKEQCYLMQTSYALQQNNYDFGKAFTLCRDVADKDFSHICYQSIGRDASGSTVSDIGRTKANCDKAPDNGALENCMLGAVRDFVSFHHSDAQAKDFCAVFQPDIRSRCLQEVETYYATFR